MSDAGIARKRDFGALSNRLASLFWARSSAIVRAGLDDDEVEDEDESDEESEADSLDELDEELDECVRRCGPSRFKRVGHAPSLPTSHLPA